MGAKTKIPWSDASWNPVTGCTKVSAGCKHCYAERYAGRHLGDFGEDVDFFSGTPLSKLSDTHRERMMLGDEIRKRRFSEVRCHPDRLDIPLHWRKPRKVFVCSMGDLFHEAVSEAFIHEVLDTVLCCDQHTFQVLTKRADRCRTVLTKYWDAMREKRRQAETWCDYRGIRFTDLIEIPFPNLWVGISCEDQATADARIPLLLQTPAALRFVSYEPALGPVNFECFPSTGCPTGWMEDEKGIDWIICGAESGPRARTMDIEWARLVRDQCVTNDLPFFYKQGPSDPGGTFKLPVLDGRESWREFPH